MAAEGSLVVVSVLAAGDILVQSAIADLRGPRECETGTWAGILHVPIDMFAIRDSGDLELQMPDGTTHRFVIVESSTYQTGVVIRGFGPPPF